MMTSPNAAKLAFDPVGVPGAGRVGRAKEQQMLRQFWLVALASISAIGSASPAAIAVDGRETIEEQLTRTLKKSKALKVEYMSNKNRRILEISDPKQVKQLLGTLDVESVEKGVMLRSGDVCSVVFILADGASRRYKFEFAQMLGGVVEEKSVGLVTLRDARFYDKISEFMSKKEGKPVDPLKEVQRRCPG
jgi:hypothetical protein